MSANEPAVSMKVNGLLSSIRGPSAKKVLDRAFLMIFSLSSAVLISSVCSRAVTPRWTAPGYPSYFGYPKNVELKALGAVIILTPLLSILYGGIRSTAVKGAVCFAALGAGLLSVYGYLSPRELAPLTLPLLSVLALLVIFSCSLDLNEGPVRPPARSVNLFLFIGAGAVGTFWYFLISLDYLYALGVIDAHHMGETFTSALDFMNGGRPAVTFFWPHGLHDTGVAALFFKIFGRADIPTLFMADAAYMSLAAVAILILGYGLGLGYYSILVLAVLLSLYQTFFYRPLGVMVFVLLSFLIYAKAKSRYLFFLAGAVGFVAHIYRIEYGVYGFMAVIALAGYLTLSSFLSGDPDGARENIISALLYVSGVLVFAVLMFLVFGWPGPEWYRTYFLILPGYLSDSAGLPYSLPLLGNSDTPRGLRISVLYATAVVGLAAAATGYMYARLRRYESIDRFFVVLVLFSIASVRTAFGRSSTDHTLQFSGFLFLFLCLCVARNFSFVAARAYMKILIVATPFVFFDFFNGGFTLPRPGPLAPMLRNSGNILAGYRQKVPAQCSEGLFSSLNMNTRPFREYDGGICQIKEVLKVFGIKSGELLVGHSASLIYPSLGYSLPTKYYCIGWAITGEMQRELVSELDRSGVKAVLKAKKSPGILLLEEYDIPDVVRLPVYSEWFGERFDLENPVSTSLGEIYLRKDVAYGRASAGAGMKVQ